MTRSNIVNVGILRAAANLVLATLVIPFGLTGGVAVGQDQPAPQPVVPPFPVTIRIDAAKTSGEMRPVWRFFGYDEPNYTYMKDGSEAARPIEVPQSPHGLSSAPTTC